MRSSAFLGPKSKSINRKGGRALRNSTVSYFSEGARLQGWFKAKVSKGLISIESFFTSSTLISVRKIQLISLLLLFFLPSIFGQNKNISFDLASAASYITPRHIPFWLRSNQFGSIPLDNASLSLIGSIHKDYDNSKARIFDWGFSLEGRGNIGDRSNFILIEGYAKVRISIFEISAGRSKEIMGLCDTSLTSGSWAVSGNAPGIPKVQISIPEFYSLPFFGRLFAFKGNYAQGWIGKTAFGSNDVINQKTTYFHQKSLYGRFGKPYWKFKLYGGFNHQVIWCNENAVPFSTSLLKTYASVITGRNRIGDHLGSIDLGFEYSFKNLRLLAYRQNIYDAGALYHFANIRDGLNGISLTNTRYTNRDFQWRKMLVEVLYTKNQAGEMWSPRTNSGDENYYNNDQYLTGWSYKGLGIGNPFISDQTYTREGLPADPIDYFINNRVVVFHFGFEGSIQKYNFILKTSCSLNYGTFGTSPEGHTIGKLRTPPVYGIFGEKKQQSTYLNINKELKQGVNIGFTGAFDLGELYYNSSGLLLNVSKSF